MLTFSLPNHLQVRLGRLRADPEFQELLRALPEPHLPLYKRSPSAGAAATVAECQKDDWIYSSGMVQGWNLLLAHFGVEPTK
jgi:hypothetical protein